METNKWTHQKRGRPKRYFVNPDLGELSPAQIRERVSTAAASHLFLEHHLRTEDKTRRYQDSAFHYRERKFGGSFVRDITGLDGQSRTRICALSRCIHTPL